MRLLWRQSTIPSSTTWSQKASTLTRTWRTVVGRRMAGRRSDVLYAKIRRGGMGTGMPNFGTVFTPEETWALVDYLWRLAYTR